MNLGKSSVKSASRFNLSACDYLLYNSCLMYLDKIRDLRAKLNFSCMLLTLLIGLYRGLFCLREGLDNLIIT